MSKLRSVSTGFWSDPFIEDLNTNQKLLFLYLITNEKTNMLGIYEASIKKISFETDIKKDVIENAFKLFEKKGKVKYFNNYVLLINYMKHQNFNTNMKKSAIDVYNELPEALKIKGLTISKDNPSEGFESLLKGLGMVSKYEVEYEVKEEVKSELEVKSKKGVVLPFETDSFLKFWNLWKDYKKTEHKFQYKSEVSEQAALKALSELAKDELTAIKIIEQSLANGYKGLFELKNQNNGTNQNNGRTVADRLRDTYSEKIRKQNQNS